MSLGVIYLLYMLYFKMSCVYCCELLRVLLLVVLCVLLSPYVYLLYCVCIAAFTLDAGLLARSLFGRSCDRLPRHRFFLVSLCL